jgi:ankyrin repeat protein
MIKEATDILTKVQFPELQDLDSEYPNGEEELLAALDTLPKKHEDQLLKSEIPARFQHLAYQIYLSYTSEHRTHINEDEAIKWLYWAAMAQKEFATLWYWCYEDSFQDPPPTRHAYPRRLWAVKAMLEGSKRSEILLKNTAPVLCAQIKSAFHRLYWGRKSRQTQRFTMSWPEIQAWVQSDKTHANAYLPVHSYEQDYHETALHYATAIGDLDFVEYLITVAGADVNALNRRNESAIFYANIAGQFEMAKLLLSHGADITKVNHHGIGIVHTLTRFNDADAATLLPDLLCHGLDSYPRTSKDSIRASAAALDIPAVLPTLAIVSAAMRQQQRLFDGFLEAHRERRLEQSDLILLLVTLVNHHLSKFLGQVLLSVEKISEVPEIKAGQHTGVQVESVFTPLDASITSKKQNNETNGNIVTHDLLLYLFQRAIYADGLDIILRRSLHGKQASLEKRETIETLLKFGSTATVKELDISEFARKALRQCILSGDNIALTTCMEVFSERGQDLANGSADQSLYGGNQALGISINRDAYDNFLFLLDTYPLLRDIADSHGETSLHQAAKMRSTRYVERLLERGADRYVRNQTGETPFFKALVSGPNLEVATLLAKGTNMNIILGRCPVTGLTAFSRLLDLMVQWKQNIDIRTLQYLVDNYGPLSMFFDQRTNMTVFRYLLSSKTPYTDTEQLDKEVAIFRYMADLLKDDVNSMDPFGLAPLHYAALFANPNAVKILLEQKATANILTIESMVQGTENKAGLTPLACALLRKKNGPLAHLKEGMVDVKLWQQRMDQVLEGIVRESKDVGPGADFATQMGVLRIANEGSTSNIAVVNYRGNVSTSGKSIL